MSKIPYLHPIPVHFPLGLFPSAWGALALHLATGWPGFETGAFVMLLFATLTTPFAIASGLVDWVRRYRQAMTVAFRVKMVGAAILTVLACSALALRSAHPELLAAPLSWLGWFYLLLLTGCVAASGVVGHYGGRLVFH
jgi:uncharacterized membrane protein